MKRISKILAITLTLIVLASLFAFAAPAGAVSGLGLVLTGQGTGAAYIVGNTNIYTLTYTAASAMVATDTIVVTFPTGANIAGLVAAGDATIQATGGIGGSGAFAAGNVPYAPVGQVLTITPGAGQYPGSGSIVQLVIGTTSGVTNPTTLGDFSLTVDVKTAAAATKEAQGSATFTIKSPTIIALPGLVSGYNSAGVKMYEANSIIGAIAASGVGGKIEAGPGTYDEDVVANVASQTIVAKGDAGTVIIADANSGGTGGTVTVTANKVTIDGFVINPATKVAPDTDTVVVNPGAGNTATIQNCTIAAGTNSAIQTQTGTSTITKNTIKVGAAAASGVDITAPTTVDSNTITLTAAGTAIKTTVVVAAGITIKNNTITGASGIGYTDATASTGISITGNTFTSLGKAIVLNNAALTATIQTNTITGSTTVGTTYIGAITITASLSAVIESNVIKDNTGYSIDLAAGAVGVRVVGNQMSGNAKGLRSAANVNAVLNWWGSSAGPTTATVSGGDAVTATGGAVITSSPFLTSTVSAARTSLSAAPGALAANFQTTAGVVLTGYTALALGELISAQKLTDNPKTVAPPYTAIQYVDIYTSATSTTNMQLKLYATGIKANTLAYVWNAVTNTWVQASSQGVAGTGDYVWVNISSPAVAGAVTTIPMANDLTGTPFVLVSGPEPAPAAFAITAPQAGASVALTNVALTWAPVAGASSYKVVVSTNADLSSPVVSATAASAGYIITATLTDGRAYLWQITALQGDKVIGQSVVGSFVAAKPVVAPTPIITMPAQPTPIITMPPITFPPQPTPIITIPAQPTPIITVPAQPAPNITVTVPPATAAPAAAAVTPGWIYAIIAIGAILVIAVLVLIVRTRRAA